MMKVLFILILTFTVTLLGCNTPTDPHIADLYGSWQWVRSSGGFAGSTITPATEGYTERIVFNAGELFQLYRNDVLQVSARFTINRQKSPMSPDTADVIHYISPTHLFDQIISLVGHDTLSLVDLCMDCYRHTYVREF